jgi:hypothetical protein
MIKINKDKIRVRCLECKEEHFIPLNHISTDKEQRSLGYEYEHTYQGDLNCSNCTDDIKISLLIYEYPKGWINYVDTVNEGCLVMGDIEYDKNLLKI